MEIAGKGAIVTGGASGLGLATVRMLLDQGARVCVVDRRDPPPGLASPGDLLVRPADVSDEDQMSEAVAAAAAAFGGLHVLVNCAGVGLAAPTVSEAGPLPLKLFRRVLEVNVTGTFNAIRLASDVMMRNQPDTKGERGVIVNTASTVAFEGQRGTQAYAASKGAVVAMTLPLAREFAPWGIRIVSIAPGIFDTPMFNSSGEDMKEWLAELVPFPPRLGDPPEYAALVRQIIENTMLNGTTLRLDGALTVGTGVSVGTGPSGVGAASTLANSGVEPDQTADDSGAQQE
jgi:NAD(P)-dependent dehydrogenase (short-subunit alcohol dehydrogenase family)